VHKGLEHVLVGAGPLLARVRRRARVQELSERLRLTAHCSLLPDLLGHVRLVWQSGSVALGGAILDGMARGVPAVAIDSDAARQLIVDGETGRVVPALPESELPRRAFNIIEDDALAARFAAAARSRAVERFPAASMPSSGFSRGRCRPLRRSARRERTAGGSCADLSILGDEDAGLVDAGGDGKHPGQVAVGAVECDVGVGAGSEMTLVR
jgi:hypothetical protein